MTEIFDESESVRTDVMGEFEAEFTPLPTSAPEAVDAPVEPSAVTGQTFGRRVATVSVIVPTRNEALNLPYVAERMPEVDEIIVVDGNSSDDTLAVAERLWPEATIISQTRGGKGNALACGFEAASCDIIVMIDADGSTDPAEIPQFVDALLAGADLAKGSRFSAGGDSDDITAFRRLGNKGLNWLVNRIFDTQFADLCYGYNAFWRKHLPVLDLPATTAVEDQWGDGFEIETIINVRMIRAGLRIHEVGSFESKRIHGNSNLNAFSDGMRVLRTINKERRSHRTARVSAISE
ncbi:MAG: glycosyltransferase family 2 protein [Gordonia sp. (in: high G+C Gram-positive bacteria)]